MGGSNTGTGSTYSFIAFCCFFLGGCWLCLSPKHDPLFCQKDDEPGATGEKLQEDAAAADIENPGADPSSPPAEEEKPSAQILSNAMLSIVIVVCCSLSSALFV